MKTVLAAAVLIAVSSSTAHGQERPDLSGTWVATQDVPPGEERPARTPVLGQQFGLRRDGASMVLIQRVRDMVVAAPHSLDGSQTRSRIPGRLCEADAQTISTMTWEGDALVYTVVGSVAPGAATPSTLNIRRVLRASGTDTLIAEGMMRNSVQGPPVKVFTVYRRDSAALTETPGAQQPSGVKATIAQVSWIGGTWIGTTQSSAAEERWTPPAGGSMLSVARTLRDGRMTGFEFLCISERQGTLVYSAMPNGRMPATDFVLTAIDETSATFENPAHDFPKKIRYALRNDGSLEATVSGTPADKPQVFVFKKER